MCLLFVPFDEYESFLTAKISRITVFCSPVCSLVGRFKIKDVKPTEAGESSKVKVKVRMNIHGVFKVKSATMVEKCPPEPEQPDTAPPESMDTEPPTPQPGTEAKAKEESDGKAGENTDAGGNGCTDTEQNGPESMEEGQAKSTEEGQTKSTEETQAKSTEESQNTEPMEQNPPNSVEVRAEAGPLYIGCVFSLCDPSFLCYI